MTFETTWPFVRLAYLWFWHILVLSTAYRNQRSMIMRMNTCAIALTPLFFYPLLPLPGISALAVELTGMVVIAISYALTLRAKAALTKHNWDVPRSGELPKTIVTTGPYRRIRHPLYAAMIFGTGSQFMITGSWLCLPLIALFTLLGVKNALHDEKKLLASPLGDTYRAYCDTVKHRFLPFIV